MKRYNYRLVKTHRIYTIKELSRTLVVHVTTVRAWIKQGLNTVKNSKCPILIKGLDAKNFLKQRSQKRKCKLKENEIFCLRCRKACMPVPENIHIEILELFLSADNRKAVIYSKCEECDLKLMRFSSERIVNDWLKRGWVFKENVVRRYNSNKSSGNPYTECDIITTLMEGSNV